MAESTFLPGLAAKNSELVDSSRHSIVVRITHWINTVSFLCLLVSGIAILLAHPRLYWGETGAVGSPSLIDLPFPFVLDVPIRGPGRYLHFLAAWVCVLNGGFYVLSGFLTRHFRRHLAPSKSDLAWTNIKGVLSNHLRFQRPGEEQSHSYNILQRSAYLGVVFVLFPLMIVTGLAMSPAVTSVFPVLVTGFGGQQSARTIHFFVACALVLFLFVHVAMVCRAGFVGRTRSMITGHAPSRKEPS